MNPKNYSLKDEEDKVQKTKKEKKDTKIAVKYRKKKLMHGITVKPRHDSINTSNSKESHE